MNNFEAILFDFDGVLLDSEPVHCACWMEALGPLGVPVTWEVYAANCVGSSDRDMMRIFARLCDPPADPAKLWEEYPRKKKLFQERMEAAVDPIRSGRGGFLPRACSKLPPRRSLFERERGDRAAARSCGHSPPSEHGSLGRRCRKAQAGAGSLFAGSRATGHTARPGGGGFAGRHGKCAGGRLRGRAHRRSGADDGLRASATRPSGQVTRRLLSALLSYCLVKKRLLIQFDAGIVSPIIAGCYPITYDQC